MRETLLALYRLQQIDSRSLEFERAAEQFPVLIHELEARLDLERTELGALVAESDTLKKEQSEAEGQIREETEKIHKWKRRLNDIKTPREYQALSREVEQLERQVRELEERVVAIMEELEGRQAVLDEKEASLRAAEADVGEQVRKLREEERALRKQSEEAKKGRAEVLGTIADRYRQLYDRMRQRRQGLAVAIGTDAGSCSGCNFVVRAQQMLAVRKLESVETCPNCGRILVPESLALSPGSMHDGKAQESAEA